MSKSIFTVGTEISELKYEGFLDWLVKIHDPFELWAINPVYILSQVLTISGGIFTLVHALRNKGCLPYLWISIVLNGLIIESMSYFSPNIDNFWHAQSPVMFFGRLLPLHIIFLYPHFFYNAIIAARKAHLPLWAEPFAVGLVDALIDIPFDIVSVMFLHWSWHDTDPNIADRHYWVPWTSYYFHMSFTASFAFCYRISRKWICKADNWESPSAGPFQELKCAILAAPLGVIGGILLFIPIYHPLHDMYGIHTEIVVFVLLVFFVGIVWSADRNPTPEARQGSNIDFTTFLLILELTIHYLLFLCLTIFGKPEDVISIGLHEKTGPCKETQPVYTASGLVLSRSKYLCTSNYSENYDFHCIPNGKPPSEGMSWYTICGTPFSNRIEYVIVISCICVLAFAVFANLHFSSGVLKRESSKSKIKSINK